jgi:hypothetical protein
MSDEEPSYTAEELTAEVQGILRAISSGGEVKAERAMMAMAYVQALMLDIHPTVTARSHMREATEIQAAAILTYLRVFRQHFEATGEHFLEQIGGSVLAGWDSVEGMTKQ